MERNRSEMKITISELNNSLERINSRLDGAEDQISKLETTVLEIIVSSQKENEKENAKEKQ